jgi:hypothetical protein
MRVRFPLPAPLYIMQTFLPYPSFGQSLECLDTKRLGKQRLEAMQLVNSILKLRDDPNAKVGWANHPARKMWFNHLDALKLYHNYSLQVWTKRGYINNMKYYDLDIENIVMPDWIGDNRVHASHRSNLLRKDFSFYSKFGWSEPSNLPYFWPIETIVI